MVMKELYTYINKVKMLLVLGLCLFLMSCGEDSFLDRRELYRINNLNARVSVELDWEEHFGEIPSGMSLYTYNEKHADKVRAS